MVKPLWIVCALTLLPACEDSSDSGTRLSFNDFKIQVARQMDSSSLDCGTVMVNDETLEANTCMANAFNNDEAFFAVYELQGIDSQVGHALTYQNNRLLFWYFDSAPGGSLDSESSIISDSECVNPTLSGVLDGEAFEVFICDE